MFGRKYEQVSVEPARSPVLTGFLRMVLAPYDGIRVEDYSMRNAGNSEDKSLVAQVEAGALNFYRSLPQGAKVTVRVDLPKK